MNPNTIKYPFAYEEGQGQQNANPNGGKVHPYFLVSSKLIVDYKQTREDNNCLDHLGKPKEKKNKKTKKTCAVFS
jgi:hypothetical protein